MARLYSKQLIAIGEFSGDVTVGSPPASTIWVIRDVCVVCYEIGTVTINMYFESGPVVFQLNLDGSPFYEHLEMRAVINADDILHVNATDNAGLLISGYELTLP
jgi:hypothetical protein